MLRPLMNAASGEPAAALPANPVLATVSRGEVIESRHRGALAVVENGRLVAAFGDVATPVFCRSSTKPFQALPALERKLPERLGFSARERAMMIASHAGSQRHVEVVQAMLASGGFQEHDLQCGPHVPYDKASAYELIKAGHRPSRLHNNCSGKHAGFLHLTRELGERPAEYLEPETRAQRLVRAGIAEMAEVPDTTLLPAIDGCGAPTYQLPLQALAHAFARLANPEPLGPVRASACRSMLDAITQEPFFLAGQGQLTTALVEALPGRIFPKNGAEGVYAFGVPGRGLGCAVKIDDGHERGYFPVVLEVLLRLGVLPRLPEALAEYHRVPLYNTQKKLTGHVASALVW